ncbi:hypothetical protein ASD62_03420 [Phycicoccus sp. Root563]|uniref:hypothetical protein n=1 Tax=Phycicoccus sp. Root563 TaxID=1736562 RepID=UPI000702797D|nr:hypothetical protein [Phycicoccus sp. Root563]KQZ88508.1 hypothetical protein ASD62_03420 [Phycicoccus sp. Root563]
MALSTSRRNDPPAFFPSWDDYLKRWKGTADPTFCAAITDIYAKAVQDAIRELDAEIAKVQGRPRDDPDRDELLRGYEKDRDQIRARLAFPWITPVLGSGCLGLSEAGSSAAVEAIPRLLADQARAWGRLPEGRSAAEVVETFGLSLVRSRLGPMASDRDSAEASSRTAQLDALAQHDVRLAARATLCAHLLTRLYFEVGTLADGAIARSEEPLTFSSDLVGPTPRGAELVDLLVVPLKAQLTLLRSETKGRHEQLAFVADFAQAVLKDLDADEPSVTRSDATLMSEIAWHFMTQGTSQYPGWSDLLTQLILASESAVRSHRWPHLDNLSAARARLHAQFIQTTVDSWSSRVRNAPSSSTKGSRGATGVSPSARDGLYDAVAELLIAQAARHASSTDREGREQFPPAVAFVTSFDLELEMALLAARTPFRLVVPFYVGTASEAKAFVWLQTTIAALPPRTKLTLNHLFALRVTRGWSLLTSHPDATKDDFTLPIVVRVAGSPLIKVEGFDDLDEQEEKYATRAGSDTAWVGDLVGSLGGLPGRTLAGTVLLDEYTALHQWAAELAQPPHIDPAKGEERLGLPARLFKGGMATDARFWFALGVQLSDEAVRHRTAAVVGTADLRSHVNDAQRTTERAGVVVNRRTTPNEREVFLWQGLDVVAATYERVVPALRHMAAHTANPDLRRLPGERSCTIEGGAA